MINIAENVQTVDTLFYILNFTNKFLINPSLVRERKKKELLFS